MAKGVRLGNISIRVENWQERLAEKLDKKAAAGYYNRPRPSRSKHSHLVILPSGVAKRVKS